VTTDQEILSQINALVAEEDRLRGQGHGLDDQERARLEQLEVALDQCWDLLRQRRARREFGEAPDLAEPRPPEVVESYDQ
jgi:hypothetical protein